MAFEFGNTLGWFAFLALVPLIIVYLIKPKPTVLKVPSLMFFIKRSSVRITQSLFRRFQNDLLFLLQLIVLLFLAFSVLEPSLTLNRDVVSGNIVFVLDVSASSQVMEDGGKTRLEIAKEKIKELATSRNSLILMESAPVIALENVRRSELVRYLDKVQSTDAGTDIASAIILAGEMLSNSDGRVVVVSDFIESRGINAEVAKNVLESRGIGVDFVDVKGSKRKNIGIVDMVISGEEVNIYLKNYNDAEEIVSLKINEDANELRIGPGSVEPVVFQIKSNLTEVEILNEDDFSVDNKAVVTRPYPDLIKILWVTNKESRFLDAAFSSIEGVGVTVAEPPIIPKENYDIYVVSDLSEEQLAFDNMGQILRKVRDDGKRAVVVAQPQSTSINYEGLLPFKFGNFTEGDVAQVDQVSSFTKDIDFGSMEHMFMISERGSSFVSVGNNTAISMYTVGKGKVVYYGLIEDESDFELTPGYPIFWNNLIYSFVGRGDLNSVNVRTGVRWDIGNETKSLDKVGIYQLGNLPIAANLINERESDINFEDEERGAEYAEGKLEKIEADVDYRLDNYLVVISLLIILFEFIYIKYRGEI